MEVRRRSGEGWHGHDGMCVSICVCGDLVVGVGVEGSLYRETSGDR